MENLRRREINAATPFRFQLAADARFSRTHYSDDQVWRLNPGGHGQPALAFQTQFGGRADLVSLVPMWLIEGHRVYERQSYASPPVITHFAPGYLRVEAAILPELTLAVQYWCMESQAAGGEYLLTNQGEGDIPLQLDIFGHVILRGRRRKLNVLTFGDDVQALHLGQIGDINPVLTLEGASLDVYGGRISSPKIGCKAIIPRGETVRIPFVVAGLADMRDSASLAMNWLSRPWSPFFERIDRAAAAIPQISTGSDAWDHLIDWSYVHLVNGFMNPTDALPHPSFVANRAGHRGWSRRGGRDHIRAWAGQDPTLACLTVPAVAAVHADFARGIILNYLAVQDESGFIDRRPGLAGQRQGILMTPLLARLAWVIYQQTDDREFIRAAFSGLAAFFERWFESDMDADGDGVPEWQSERQMGYVAFPTFGGSQAWAQGADTRHMETPDLLALLISEADALHDMARLLEENDAAESLAERRTQLEAHLAAFWDGRRYAYRDRDTHAMRPGMELLHGGRGDQIHTIDRTFPVPERLLIRIVGGRSQRPRITLALDGRDEQGRPCRIQADADDFLWHNHRGIYATPQTLSYIGDIQVSGLSRVYKVGVSTLDSSRLDINHLLPLWTGRLPASHARALVKLAMDDAHFMRPNGLTMVSASDPNFDPSNARGGGGIWMHWLSLIGEGMIKAGYRREATQLIKTVLTALTDILEKNGHFSQFYHADDPQGFGEDHHIGGIVPLHLLSRVAGIQIVSHRKVWVGGDFTWGSTISVKQHGVAVTRSADEIRIDFPSGHGKTLDANLPWQAVADPTPADSMDRPPPLPEIPAAPDGDEADRVVIEVDSDDDPPAPADEIPGD